MPFLSYNAPSHARLDQELYKIVNTCDASIASWTLDGNQFIIKDKEKFTAEVILRNFKMKQFDSFNRQLNFYGFTKVQSVLGLKNALDAAVAFTSKEVVYHHPCFKRNRPDLLGNILRTTNHRAAQKNRSQGQRRTSEVEAIFQHVKVVEEKLKDTRLDFEARILNLRKKKELILNCRSHSALPAFALERERDDKRIFPERVLSHGTLDLDPLPVTSSDVKKADDLKEFLDDVNL